MSAPMDIAPIVVWAAGISTLLGLGTTIYNLLTSGARKNDTRIADLSCKLDDLEREHAAKLAEMDRRMQRNEDRLATVPSIEMMHRLELSMTTINGELGKFGEQLKPVAAIAERMQELMLERARNGS